MDSRLLATNPSKEAKSSDSFKVASTLIPGEEPGAEAVVSICVGVVVAGTAVGAQANRITPAARGISPKTPNDIAHLSVILSP